MLIEFFEEFFVFLIELVVLFFVINLVVALLQRRFSRARIKKVLSSKNAVIAGLKGVAIGFIVPFCSCSAIPFLVALIQSHAPFNLAISYLVSAPLLNPVVLILFSAFFGLKITILYTVIIFSFAILTGLLLDKMGLKKELKEIPLRNNHDCKNGQLKESLKESFLDSFVILKKIFPFILMGAFIGALIHGFLPTDFIVQATAKAGAFDIPIASAVSLPLHVHHLSVIIPAAHALVQKGLGIGVVISIIIAGAGLSIAEISLLSAVFKRRLTIAFSTSIFLIAMLSGYLFLLLR